MDMHAAACSTAPVTAQHVAPIQDQDARLSYEATKEDQLNRANEQTEAQNALLSQSYDGQVSLPQPPFTDVALPLLGSPLMRSDSRQAPKQAEKYSHNMLSSQVSDYGAAVDGRVEDPFGVPTKPQSINEGKVTRSVHHPVPTVTTGRIDRWTYAYKMCRRMNKVTERSLRWHREWLPESEIAKISESEVMTALFQSRKKPIIVQRPESYRRILAVLYFMKQPTKIRRFVEGDVCDLDLPLRLAAPGGKLLVSASATERNIDGQANTAKERAVRLKKREDAEEFCNRQWTVLAPVFAQSETEPVPHKCLQKEMVLPFKSAVRSDRRGAFGEVAHVEIHSDHHEPAVCKTFAVKNLKSNSKSDFTSEVTILKKLTTVHAHEHLVTLFATYEVRGEKRPFYLVFPWAEADLFHLWKRVREPRRGPDMESWISEQCTGLMAALRELHRYWTYSTSSVLALIGTTDSEIPRPKSDFEKDQGPPQRKRIFGRHGDIKPDNILWFPLSPFATEPHEGILKIADFGSARFSTRDYWSNRKTGWVPNSLTYRSPEYELSGVCTTLCDVWALGCVYLEFVAWYIGGYALFISFANKRLEPDERLGMRSDTFFTIQNQYGRKVPGVKRSVSEMIDTLQSSTACGRYLKALLKTVRTQMIVVHQNTQSEEDLTLQHSTSDSLLVPEQARRRRSSSGLLFQELGDIAIHPRPD